MFYSDIRCHVSIRAFVEYIVVFFSLTLYLYMCVCMCACACMCVRARVHARVCESCVLMHVWFWLLFYASIRCAANGLLPLAHLCINGRLVFDPISYAVCLLCYEIK